MAASTHGGGRRGEVRAPTSEAVEDYAKAIYSVQGRDGSPAGTNALADRVGVSPASVSAMVKRLAELGLVEHEPYRGVRLTPAGEKVALEVIRHHRLLEAYLSDALGMPWDRVHAEAEVLEHYLSDELEELIAHKLGDPPLDPHGDPIPDRDLTLPTERTRALADLEPGEGGTFTRVSDSNSDMLRYLSEQQVCPGMKLRVEDKQPFGGPVFVDVGGRVLALGGALARSMRVSLDS